MHTYPHPITGAPLPSVTTILNQTMPEERKAQLMMWYASNPQAHFQNAQSQERGNSVDKWAKCYLSGRPIEVDFRYASYCAKLQLMLDFIKSSAEAVLLDEFVWTDKYGGTLDIAFTFEGTLNILDIKTKNHIFLPAIEENKLQVFAYKEALEMKYPDLPVGSIAVVAVTKSQCQTFRVVADSNEMVLLSVLWHQRLQAYCGLTGSAGHPVSGNG